MNIVISIGILINISCNYFLIHLYGAYGAAIATLMTQSFVALSEFILIRNLFKIRFNLYYILSIFTFILGVCAINFSLSYVGTAWWFNFVLSGLCSILWAVVTQLINLKRILSLFRTKNV